MQGRGLTLSLLLYLPSRAGSWKRNRRRELSRCGNERGTERRKENTLAGARLHGVTRKYDAPKASRRGTKRPRRLNPEFSSRGLLGGSTRNTLPPSSLPSPPLPRHSSSSRRSPLAALSTRPVAQPSSQKRAERFAKGVPHTGPHRSPCYLSRQISRLWYTPCNVATTVRSLRDSLPSAFLYSVVSASSSLPFALLGSRVLLVRSFSRS